MVIHLSRGDFFESTRLRYAVDLHTVATAGQCPSVTLSGMEQLRTALTGGTACEVCGRLPHPRRLRLTLAKLLAIFPVEFALHAAVLAWHPPYLVSVSLLVFTTTALVIWAIEQLTHQLAQVDANILGLHVHPVDDGVRDEFVVSTPDTVGAPLLLEAIEAAG